MPNVVENEEERDNIEPEGARGLERVNGFSDAVFAVAITLLILTVIVPEVSDVGQLRQELVDMWPKFFGFLLSFVIIGAFWMGHHAIFGYLRRYTRGLLWINLFLLMFIVLLPFSTDLMSEYNGSELTVVFYDLNMIAVTLALSLLWWYVSYRNRLVDESLHPAVRRHLLLNYLSMSLVFGVSAAIALVNIPASQYIYLALIPSGMFLGHKVRRDTA
jgi:uncharacterized membrane protein